LIKAIPTNERTADREESFVDVGTTLEADPESSELVKPGNGSFDHPTEDAESAAMFGITSCDQCADSHRLKRVAMRLRIVTSVRNKYYGFASRVSGFSSNVGNRIDQRNELSDIMRVGASEKDCKWNAVSVGYDMMLAPRFPSVRGIRTDFRPPKTALTELESAIARHQSILSALFSLASINSWIFCQTPASCQSRRYRQQLIPEPQPISFGSISQGIPLLSTKIIPVSALRRSIGFRPGYRYFLSFGFGSIGSMSSHSSSGISSFAMCVLHHLDSTLNLLKSFPFFAHYVRGSKKKR
jgi:hypothetical protein